MYILEIIPIATGLPENYFSYFSRDKLSLGTLVEIKIKNRKVSGLVSEVNKVEKEKINLKSQKFSLKKIERVIKENFINEKLFQSLKEISILLGVKESELIKNYIPEFIFENIELFTSASINLYRQIEEKAILGDFKKRHTLYLEICKENFKLEKSIAIFFPTINDLEQSREYFESKNIQNILTFHSKQNKKELKENLKKLENKNLLILSTSSIFPFLISNQINLQTTILEKENSYNYFTHTAKKQIDAREIIKKLSRDLSLNLILGGNILSLMSFKEFQNKISKEEAEKNVFEIIDLVKEKGLKKEEMRRGIKKISERKNNKYNSIYFSEKLIEKLEKIRKEKLKAFLYAKRKGFYTETICTDCNTIFKCKDCDKPYILFKKENTNNSQRFYICGNCKEKIQLKKTENLICENCGSWKMNTLGIGTQGIEENLKEIGFKTFVLDGESAKSKKEIKNILDAWQEEKNSILIGTDLALNFLNKDLKIDLGAIISLDSLFSIPEINIDEKIFNICLELAEKINSKEKIVIETRLKEQDIWNFIKEKDVLGFLKEELETRESFSLPPYSNILKFRLNNKEIKYKNNLENILERIFKEEKIKPKKISWRLEKKTENHIGTLIIPENLWQIKKEGKNLPTSFAKKVVTLFSDFNLEINPPNIY